MPTVPRSLWIVTLGLALAACATPPGGDAARERRIAGQGPAVVVFQNGLGDTFEVWQAVQRATEPLARTIAYNRAGYGRSPRSDQDRNPCQIADEQHALLKHAGLAPPYVLVGHSLGGLYQYAFAKRYPDEIAGLVLLDPTHPDHWAEVRHNAPAMAAIIKLARVHFKPVMRAEFDAQATCIERLRDAPMPPVPVRLLTRGEFRAFEAGAFEAVARRLEADWCRLLGVARAQRVAGAGHYIQRDAPQVVAEAIARVVRAQPAQ